MKSDRLAALIDAHLDGSLSPAEAVELSQALIESDEARCMYWTQAALHGVLPEAVQLQWLSQASPQAAAKVIPISAPAAERRRFWTIATAAAAACVLILGGWWGKAQPWWPGNTIATLDRAPGATWEGRPELTKGSALQAGRLRLRSGAAELRFKSGARLIVEAPADLELIGRNAARLNSGQCLGFVPPEARGFRVDSHDLTLVDLGTAFGLKVPPSGPAEAHVFEGEVEVTSDEAGTRRLVEGEAIRLADAVFAPIPARAEDFLSAERLAARESEKTIRRFDQWREIAGRLSGDPATLVHFTCEGQQHWDTTLRNDVTLPNADHRTAMIIGAGWAEGRWPGKSAIAFRESGDRVRFEVPGKYPKLTLLASIAIDALPNDFNALFMTENLALGDLRWQITKEGRLQFAVRTGRVADGQHFEISSTPPVIDAPMLGRWLSLVVTYDGSTGEVTHYVDGKQVASTKNERTMEAQLGALELGNWGIQLDDPKWTFTKAEGAASAQRHFSGRIDQFAILQRVLSPQDVKLYSGAN